MIIINKIIDEYTEQIALRTICENNHAGKYLQAKLNRDHFGWQPTLQAYMQVRNYFHEHLRVLTWNEVLHDPIIDQDNRQLLAGFPGTPLYDNPIALLNSLDNYRKLRHYWRANEIIQNTLFGPGQTIDLERLGGQVADLITKARSSGLREHIFTHIGTGSNVRKVVQDILTEDNTFIPTGFRTFDTRSYGLPRGEVFLATSQTGSLKTLLMYQLAINMTGYGAKICYIPLEMNERQMVRRQLANIARIPLMNLLRAKNLKPQEQQTIWHSLDTYEKRLQRIGARLSILTPDTDISVSEALTLVEPYGYDAIYMDYISLFKDADDERQWQRLGQAVRYAKIWAGRTNTLVCIAAQLNEENLVRYSRAMSEHACFTGDTLIDTPNGIFPIKELVSLSKEGFAKCDIAVTSENNIHIASYMHNNGIKPVYKLTTKNGIEIVGTGNQKFKVIRKDKEQWVDMLNLNKIDKIIFNQEYVWPTINPTLANFSPDTCTVRQISGVCDNGKGWGINRVYEREDVWFPTHMTIELARLIGYWLGDGCIRDDYISFTNNNINIINDYIRCFQKVFCIVLPIKFERNSFKLVCYKKQLIQFIRECLKVIGKSHEKTIPYIILLSTKETIANCIGALYDCDGSKSQVNGLSLTTTSHNMAQRFSILLQRLGIYVSSIKEEQPHNPDHHNRFIVSIHGAENLFNWKMIIPTICPLILPDKDFKGVQQLPSGKYRGQITINYEQIHSPCFDSYDQARTWYMELRTKYRGKMYQEVKSIEYVGDETVYDLTVPASSSFVANGIISHNSNQWRWKYDQIARETGIITIEQPKSRNQWDFTFELKVEPEFMTMRDLTAEERGLLQQITKVAGGGKVKPNGSGKAQPQPIDLDEQYYGNN